MKNEAINEEPKLVDLFSNEFENLLTTEGEVYLRKIEPIRGARQVQEPEVIETRLSDGILESTQDANVGDWVILGSEGEEFVFTNTKFNNLYEDKGNGEYLPRERKIIAIKNPFNQPVRISAPWGTPEKPAYQDGGENCMLVAELASDGTMTKDRYIIGDEELLLNNYNPS